MSDLELYLLRRQLLYSLADFAHDLVGVALLYVAYRLLF